MGWFKNIVGTQRILWGFWVQKVRSLAGFGMAPVMVRCSKEGSKALSHAILIPGLGFRV